MKKSLQNYRNNQTDITDQEKLKSIWLGERSIFQTFEGLDSIVDKETELKEIRQLLYDDTNSQSEEV